MKKIIIYGELQTNKVKLLNQRSMTIIIKINYLAMMVLHWPVFQLGVLTQSLQGRSRLCCAVTSSLMFIKLVFLLVWAMNKNLSSLIEIGFCSCYKILFSGARIVLLGRSAV